MSMAYGRLQGGWSQSYVDRGNRGQEPYFLVDIING